MCVSRGLPLTTLRRKESVCFDLKCSVYRRVPLTESTVSLICGDVDFCTLIKAQGVKLKVKTDSTEVYFLSCTKPKIEADWGDFQISGF